MTKVVLISIAQLRGIVIIIRPYEHFMAYFISFYEHFSWKNCSRNCSFSSNIFILILEYHVFYVYGTVVLFSEIKVILNFKKSTQFQQQLFL